MTTGTIIDNEYFNWLYDKACGDRYPDEISYRKLLMQLHNTEFTYLLKKDENRAADGINLRHRFADDYTAIDEADSYLTEPCSVLEMILALAIRCEETIMDDPAYGDRATQWFWGMITNLGLGSMSDNNYDKRFVASVLKRFLNRDYEPNGRGGLFYVRNCEYDLRDIEIWVQLCWYLDTIT